MTAGDQSSYPEGYPDDFQGDLFSLDRTPVKPARPVEAVNPPARQTVLFSGLDCEPGQMDLFQTDGVFRNSEKPGL
jgi:hypothetical protein